ALGVEGPGDMRCGLAERGDAQRPRHGPGVDLVHGAGVDQGKSLVLEPPAPLVGGQQPRRPAPAEQSGAVLVLTLHAGEVGIGAGTVPAWTWCTGRVSTRARVWSSRPRRSSSAVSRRGARRSPSRAGPSLFGRFIRAK